MKIRALIYWAAQKIQPRPTQEEIRRHSPRGNFLLLFDCDERLQLLKRQAHTADDPEQFEKFLFDICMEFYAEGFRVAEETPKAFFVSS